MITLEVRARAPAVVSPTNPALGGDKAFVFTQNTPSAVWEITHTLNKYPSVTVVDSAGSVVIGEVLYLSKSTIRLSFEAPFSGKAFLN